MPVMDEFREEREALKHGTLKQKISYFFCYYKWHVIITIALIAFAVSMAHQILTQKENAFFAAFINTVELETAGNFVQGFTEYAGIDMNEFDVMFDTALRINPDPASYDESTITSTQKVMVYLAAQEIDILAAGDTVMNSYAYNDSFYDLREILTAEQLAEYEPYFYYMDRTVAEERSEMDFTSADYSSLPAYPDPRNPEAMSDPIPVGIYLDSADTLKEHYYFLDENALIAVAANTRHPETVSRYLEYIFSEAVPSAVR